MAAVNGLDECLERIRRWQPRINCFVRLREEEARRPARSDGPLAGLPLAHKDMFYRRGEVATCGSASRRDWIAPETAATLERLDAAGALDLGRLNMSELAFGITGHNQAYGDCRNPWNPDYIPGGSSSGSAAAVAAGLCFAALGSDTGGSIRGPSGMCGVTGLKTTWGLVDRRGTLPLSASLDTLGPIARSAEDCTRLMEVLADCRRFEGAARIGMPAAWIEAHCHPEVAAAVLEAGRLLGARPVPMPDIETISAHCNVVMQAESASVHRKAMAAGAPGYESVTRVRIEPGYGIPAPAYHDALRLRGPTLRRFCEETLAGCDALLLPVLTIPTPTIAGTGRGSGAEGAAAIRELSRLLLWVNYVGVPALALPCGFDSRGLPIGLQLIGRPRAEPLLLAAGRAYQNKTDWHLREPRWPN